MHRLLLTFYLQTIIIYVYCYNIEQNPRSIKYLLSPSQQRLLKEQTPSVSGRVWHSDDKDGGPLPSELPSSFFGYDFNLAKSDKDNNFRAVVGAPKSKDESFTEARSDMPSTPAKGNILNCPIENIFTNNAPPVCPSIAPPGTKPGDDIGLSVAVDPRGQVSACSPTRLQDCDVVQYTPGYCYQQSRGAWKEDPTNNNKNCHSYTLDLMFVLDGSFSIGRENFEAVKSWVKNVSEKFDISDGSTQIGVIQYSAIIKKLPLDKQKYIKTEVRLGEFTEKEQLFRAVDNIELQGYTTHTASALNKSAFDFLASNRYKNASKVLILLTDGQANDKKQLPYSADYVRSLNINTFAVGVGKIKVSELKIIATGTNSTKNVFFLKNFDQLAQIVNQLRSAILTFVLEGSNNRSTAAFKLQNAETGFSIRPSVALNRRGRPSGALYLGAVGAWDWSGTIVKYDTANDQNPDIPSYEEVQKVLVNRTKESYLGYSLTSGFYNGQSSGEYVAIGAPRYNLEGAVVIYKPESGNPNFTNPSTIYPNANNAQLGSYFGGAMLTMDINDDSKDDLLVGAPLYIGTSYDLGRVYVYMATNSDNPRDWAQGTRGPIILTGTAVGGRFGSAIASAGDLNKDGYNDVIVGAPYTDDNKGSVYVFHGTGDGLNTNAQQEINAKSLSNNNLRYFGLSIQGGQDLDGNDYPDVAVGAPKSDAVVIFRTRPVVSFTGSLSFSEAKINVFDCFRKVDRNCLSLTACLTGSGAGVEDTIDVTYSISLDSSITSRDQKRVEFQGASTPDAQYMISGTEVLSRGDRLCIRHNITVKGTISDYSTPIEANFAFDLDPKHTATPLSSIRDPNAVHSYTSNTSFARGCGSDDKCKYNLVLNGDVQVPSATLTANGKDLTDGGKILVISRQTQFSPLTMKMNLTNTGDNAFDVRVSVTYNDQLGWKLGNILSSNPDPSISCVTDDSSSASESTNVDGYRSKLLVYRQNRLLGSIMESGHWCSFEVNLTSTLLGLSGTLPNINVTVYAFTIGGIADDTEKSDNTFTATNPIRYRADATVSSRSPVTTIPFNFTDANSTIVSVRQIGDNVPITYQVDSQGYSNIPISTISFTYPYTMLEGSMQHLLYLYKYSCISPQNNAQCTCDESVVNPYQLLEGYATSNTTGLNNVTVIANPNLINRSLVYDCGNKNNQTSFECQTFTCNVTNLQANDLLEFHVEFRLWSQSLNLMNDTNVTFVSHFVYDTSGSNLLINNNGENVTRISRGINTIARLFTEPIVVEQENNLWIYIVAAVAGLLLLVIIVIILWKLGFFKSKYAEKKEALEWSGPDQS